VVNFLYKHVTVCHNDKRIFVDIIMGFDWATVWTAFWYPLFLLQLAPSPIFS